MTNSQNGAISGAPRNSPSEHPSKKASSKAPRRIVESALAVAAAMVVGSVALEVTNSDDEPATKFAASSYDVEWSTLGMGAGGWVTGIIRTSDPDVMYSRTDVGGAYRWDADARRWDQMLRPDNVPAHILAAISEHSNGVGAIAVDPNNSNNVWLTLGNEESEATYSSHVMRSTDGGRTWLASTTEFSIAGNNIYRWMTERLSVEDGGRVWLGTRRQGAWFSDDGGDNFQQVSTSMIPTESADPSRTSESGVSFIVSDPSGGVDSAGNANIVYAGVSGVGVMRSADAGLNWTNIRSVDVEHALSGGEVVDGRFFVTASGPYTGTTGFVAYYENGSWTEVVHPSGLTSTFWDIVVNPNDKTEWITIRDAEISRHDKMSWTADNGATYSVPRYTTDAGDQWHDAASEPETRALPIGDIRWDDDSDRLWIAEGIGVWYADLPDEPSNDELQVKWAGDGIEELVTGNIISPPGGKVLSTAYDFHGFVHDPDNLSATPTRMIGVDSKFAGGTDIDYSGGNPDEIVWIGSDYATGRGGTGARSSDGGETWSYIPNVTSDMNGGEISISATDPDVMVWVPGYISSPWTHTSAPQHVRVTTNGGQDWTTLTDIDGYTKSDFEPFLWWVGRSGLTSDKVNSNFYLANANERFWVSSNATDWNEAPHAPPITRNSDGHVFGNIEADPYTANKVWASSGTNGLWYTTDAGQSPWTRVPGAEEVQSYGFGAALPGEIVTALYIYGRANGDAEKGFYVSGDQGQSWDFLGNHAEGILNSITFITGDLNQPGRFFTSTGGQGSQVGVLSGIAMNKPTNRPVAPPPTDAPATTGAPTTTAAAPTTTPDSTTTTPAGSLAPGECAEGGSAGSVAVFGDDFSSGWRDASWNSSATPTPGAGSDDSIGLSAERSRFEPIAAGTANFPESGVDVVTFTASGDGLARVDGFAGQPFTRFSAGPIMLGPTLTTYTCRLDGEFSAGSNGIVAITSTDFDRQRMVVDDLSLHADAATPPAPTTTTAPSTTAAPTTTTPTTTSTTTVPPTTVPPTTTSTTTRPPTTASPTTVPATTSTTTTPATTTTSPATTTGPTTTAPSTTPTTTTAPTTTAPGNTPTTTTPTDGRSLGVAFEYDSARIMDTRRPDEFGAERLGDGETIEIDTGHPEAESAFISLTAVNPSDRGYFTAYSGDTRPDTSSLNFAGGGITAVTTQVQIIDGKFTVFTNTEADVIVDLISVIVAAGS